MRTWLCTSCLLASGCATIVSTSEYDVPVECNVAGATVNVYKNGEVITTSSTPAVLTLSSKGGYFRPARYLFEFKKQGYTIDEVSLGAGFDWWFVGNAILPFGYVFALTVDPLSGAMWKFDKDTAVFGCIRPLPKSSPISPPQIKPVVSPPVVTPTTKQPVLPSTPTNNPPQMIEIDAITL